MACLPLADAAAPGLALGHALGRVGCLLGGCCYGRPVEPDFCLGVKLAGALRHPVQLYEAALLALLAAGLLLGSARLRPRPGALFSAYLGVYALMRLVTEQFRGDDAARGFLFTGWCSTSEAISGVVLVASIALWRLTRRRELNRTPAR